MRPWMSRALPASFVLIMISLQGVQMVTDFCKEPLGMQQGVISDSQLKASSSLDGRPPSRGRLHNRFAWCADDNAPLDSSYLQIDLGQTMGITKIETQGDGASSLNYVTKFKLKYSFDGTDFWVVTTSTNALSRTFFANSNSHEVEEQDFGTILFTGRYVRIIPTEKQGAHICMRVEIYGCPYVCSSGLGFEQGSVFPPSYVVSSSTSESGKSATNARLKGPSEWCASHQDTKQFLLFDFGHVVTVTGIALQGSASKNKWVTRFYVKYGENIPTLIIFQKNGSPKVFVGSPDKDSVVVNWLHPSLEIRYLQIVPFEWENGICIRTEIIGCPHGCMQPLGMESKVIRDKDLFSTHNPRGREYTRSRLNNPDAWCGVGTTDVSLTISLGSVKLITAIAFQGDGYWGRNYWTHYRLEYSYNGVTFYEVKEETTNNRRIFETGNQNNLGVSFKIIDNYGISAKSLRITMVAFKGAACGRLEVYGCSQYCSQSLGIKRGSQMPSNTILSSSTGNVGNVVGRLGSLAAWCTKSSTNPYFEIKFNSVMTLQGIAIQGSPSIEAWIRKFKVQYQEKDLYHFIKDGKDDRIFQMIGGKDIVTNIWFPRAVRTNSIKIYPTESKNQVCLRMDVYGCKTACSEKLGIESGSILDKDFKASSSLDSDSLVAYSRLNTPNKSWTSCRSKDSCSVGNRETKNSKEWIEVCLPRTKAITGLILQGSGNRPMVIKWFSLYYKYAQHGVLYSYRLTSIEKVFSVKMRRYSSVEVYLPIVLYARCLRLQIESFQGTDASLRWELLGCNSSGVPTVSVQSVTTVNRMEKATLLCEVKGQPGVLVEWTENDKNLTYGGIYNRTETLSNGTMEGVTGSTLHLIADPKRIQILDAACSRNNNELDLFECSKEYQCGSYYPGIVNKEEKKWRLKIMSIRGRASAPRFLKTELVMNTSVVLNWTLPSDTSDFAFKKYRITAESERHSIPPVTLNTHRVTIGDLLPFTNYSVTIWFINTKDVQSSPLKGYFHTDEGVATEPRDLKLSSPTPNIISIRWKEPLHRNGIISKYQILYVRNGEAKVKDHYNINEMFTNITGLNPYTDYEIKVRGFTKGGKIPGKISEAKIQKTEEGKPTAPRLLEVAENSSSFTIELKWKEPAQMNGILSHYKIRLRGRKSYNTSFYQSQEMTTSNPSAKFDTFGGTEYVVMVSAITGGGEGQNIVLNATTPAAEPEAPFSSVSPTNIGQRIILYPASDLQGPIRYYELLLLSSAASCSALDRKPWPTEKYLSVKAERLPYIADVILGEKRVKGTNIDTKLFGNITFCFRAISSSERKTLYGEAVSIIVERRSLPKTKDVQTDEISSTSVRIQLTKVSVPSVRFYHICVMKVKGIGSQVQNPNDFPPSSMKAFNASSRPFDVPYITAQFSVSDFQKLQNFKVGDGKFYPRLSLRRRRSQQDTSDGYINAPLEPSSIYSIFQRALESENSYYTGPWLRVATKVASAGRVLPPADDPTATTVGVVIAVVLVIAVLISAVLLVRRRRMKLTKEASRRAKTESVLSDFSLPQSLGGQINHVPITEEETSDLPLEDETPPEVPPTEVIKDPRYPPVSKRAFAKYCEEAKRDSYFFLSEQYSKLNNGQQFSWDCAVLAANKPKNRFANIAAYDHSRVKLIKEDDNDESNYINANFVQSYEGQTTYIACQGPVAATVFDFWRMIWDHKVPAIVMLTNLVERGKRKCEPYWPSGGSETHGTFTVHLLTEEKYADYVIRKFSLAKSGVKCKRQICHYHFVSWPDHGVPEHPTDILNFRRRFRSTFPFDQISEPVVVHCSAGVGRTGTFIAIDSLLQLVKKKNIVDIFNYINFIRSRRIHMVQTEAQYIFVYDAILEDLTCGLTEISSHNILTEIENLENVRSDGNSGYHAQFERLFLLSVKIYESESRTGRKEENCLKNRNPNVIPKDGYRVILQTLTFDDEDKTYINATYVNGYKNKDAFIATQFPLANTVADFWQMIYQNNIGTVVMLNKQNEDDVSFGSLWAEEDEAKDYGMLSVTTVLEESDNEISKRMVSLVEINASKEKRSCDVIEYKSWPSHGVPPETNSVLRLIREIEKSQQQCGNNNPTVVMCSDGCGRTGTFITAMILLDRFKVEGLIDVFQTVKKIRFFRPQFVESVEQYRFCHDIVLAYIDSFSAYGNFV